MIIYKKIRWKNFLSYGNEFTEINLSERPKTLIIGKNGQGKSVLLDAMTFALYGKPFRKINKPQLVNSINNKGLVVEIEFSVNQNEYKIIRGIKPNIFEIYQNNELINQSGKTDDYQEILETQILKKTYKTATQIDILGSAKYTSFMELTTPQRREVIEDLLDLQVFTSMNVVIKNKIKENNDQIAVKDRELFLKQAELDKIEAVSKNTTQMYQNRITEYEKNKTELYSRIDEKKAALYPLKTNLRDYPLIDIDELQNKKAEIDKGMIQLSMKKNALSKDIDFFNNNDNCPTCRQKIDDMFKIQSLGQRADLLDQYIEVEQTLNDKLKNINKELENAKTKNSCRDNVLQQINVIEIEISNIKIQLDKVINDLYSTDIEMKRQEKTQNNDTSSLKQEIKELNNTLNKLKETKKKLNSIQVALKDNGVKSLIIKEYIPIINQKINKYLQMMDFMVSFELSETFEETIKSRYRDEFSYGSFSEGQKFRINLALLFTFRDIAKMRNSVSSNLLIMDEVLDASLDDQGTDDFLNIIDHLTNEANVFIISHKTDNISDRFDRTLEFQLIKNFSKMKVIE